MLENEGRYLNRRFFTFIEKGRPYVILKWAESADGYMAPDYKPYWISSPEQTRLSHKWRTEEAAILIGSQTYIDDRSKLTARLWCGSNPKAVVLDRRGRLTNLPQEWLHLKSRHVQEALIEMAREGLQSVIVEGGRMILDAFLKANLYDELRIIKTQQSFGKGLKAPTFSGECEYY